MGMLHDKSTEQIKRRLKTPQSRYPVQAHAGVASVATDGGAKPTQPKTDDGNTAANAKFNEANKGPKERPNVVMIGGQ
jgi:hypothetical protein